ncbi:hypothetical protein EDB89DRAFT_1932161 [Lactarius sanguifluus]|nr:hypothetical protein EDB89DRAFT_1932161 [Lactarius sanguifluus]
MAYAQVARTPYAGSRAWRVTHMRVQRQEKIQETANEPIHNIIGVFYNFSKLRLKIFEADYDPGAFASCTRGSNGVRTAIANPANPVALHSTSATPPATTVACANDAEVVDELLGTLDSHEFVFGRPMRLADTLRWITLQGRHGQPRCHRKCRQPKPDWRSADEDRKHETPPPPGGNGNTLFATVTNLNAHLTAITALPLFS